MVIQKLLRAGEGRIVRRLARIAAEVNELEPEFSELTDEQLQAKTQEFKDRLAAGEDDIDDLLPEAFATVREAAQRTLGQRHFDVQLMGGAALHLGNIAEMRTGEGKTLVSTLPVYLNALAGNGVHVVTTNDYLAKRDSEWMGRVHRFLGLTVGVIIANEPPPVRRAAYACDITYGTNNEFGFDYLRDNMAWSSSDLVQRGHHFAVVDEVDSILIDEARTPLIISGPAEQSGKWYGEFAKMVLRLHRGEDGEGDYEVEEGKRTIAITEAGVEKVEDYLGIDNLYESVNTPLVGYLNNALKAKELFANDKDYIVVEGEVLIVDEFTGRVLAGRRYNEGMHQAIEAKEGVAVKDENQTLATITLQNYFRLYEKLSGMTGTAMTEASEFSQIYDIGVVPIPTNRPPARLDASDVVYKTEDAKFTAVVEDIAERHAIGQPVLVGTTSVSKSELLSSMLLRRGIPHEVLNAKFHEKEAQIVAQAGRKGAVTVSTNMAGRGTDIMLGGNPEFMAQSELAGRGLSPVEDAEAYEAAWPDALTKAEEAVVKEHEQVLTAGGLYVLGTERHESRRIDNQLRGRSGRQGDPGESRFYLSLGDDLMRLFNASAVERIMTTLNLPEDVPIESKMVSRAIRSAQTQVESQNFEIRKNVLKYDEVLNTQRGIIYGERRRILEGEDLHEQVQNMLTDVITAYVTGATAGGYSEDWDLEALWTALGQLFPVSISLAELDADRSSVTAEYLLEELLDDARNAYGVREEQLGTGGDGEPVMRDLERRVLLSVLDRKWREHLYEMDYLQEGIGLRAMAQRDPLVEYQREGRDMFDAMMEGIKEEAIGFLFNVEVTVQEAPPPPPPAVPIEDWVPSDQADGAEPTGELTAAPAAPAGPDPVQQDGATVAEAAPATTAQPAGSPEQAGSIPHPVSVEPVLPRGFGPGGAATLQYSAPDLDGGGTAVSTVGPEQEVPEVSRNAPCPCGSGRKYKRCHGAGREQD